MHAVQFSAGGNVDVTRVSIGLISSVDAVAFSFGLAFVARRRRTAQSLISVEAASVGGLLPSGRTCNVA